jgi:membrane fusion protein, multidrug efflux system
MSNVCRISLCTLLAAAILGACARTAAPEEDAAPPAAGTAPESSDVPVHVAQVRHETMEVLVTATGRTEALRQNRIRAPFASRVVSLSVADGDHVAQGQVIAVVVSKDSAAALAGAGQMLAGARDAADKADAQRAVDLARQQLVQHTLRAAQAGVVLSHGAESGDYVDDGEVLVTLAETGSVFFNAQVAQSDAERLRAGQAVRIELPAVGGQPLSARVHGRLPVASSENFSIPVRLDFDPARANLELGLFGTASIVVARRADAAVVPAGAILRDDISGVSRVAVVESGVAHWLDVQPGAQVGDRVEILQPAIAAGTSVIVQGQVGLPDNARVAVQP